ncbi:cytidylyltransferase domain-containing protein, partial [Leptospira bandrabouensis]|uniref:cytidylyltransferase domain-containing protein n=2 Tax=Leptospira TaxID=171 RepID=UPI003B9753AE|nr:3-deoxy-manno-octulosonate cytidylyltransferase [Leptospira bandrabouensis]
MKKILGVIPARYASSRFPGKPLAKIGDKTMIEWTYRNASRSTTLSELVVATDDERIHDVVLAFGGKSVMTSADHPSGTDRIIEVAEKFPEFSV